MNTDLLRRVRDQILATPRQFNMEFWAHVTDCGTAHCIAGWAVKLGGQDLLGDGHSPRTGVAVGHAASVLLGLSDPREETILFYTEDWPEEFRLSYESAYVRRDHARGAQIAAERIDHFIATDGAE